MINITTITTINISTTTINISITTITITNIKHTIILPETRLRARAGQRNLRWGREARPHPQ